MRKGTGGLTKPSSYEKARRKSNSSVVRAYGSRAAKSANRVGAEGPKRSATGPVKGKSGGRGVAANAMPKKTRRALKKAVKRIYGTSEGKK